MRTIRRADAGLAGNGGQFAPTARGDVPIDLLPTPQTAPGREIMLDPEVDDLAKSVETSFDADGRSVMIIGIDREQLPTSSYRVGTAPWEIDDEEITDEQVDTYLESRSDDPEGFADDLGFDGQVRWNSSSSTLELIHTGFEGISDQDMSVAVSETLRDFRDELALTQWP